MKSVFLVSVALSMSQVALASDYMTVKETLSSEKYTYEIEYPVLSEKAAKAYLSINKLVRDSVAEGCSVEDAMDANTSFDHTATAEVLTLNKNYVSYREVGSNYCGGAHPNHYTTIKTYDANLGSALDMNKEVPRQDWSSDDFNWEDREAFRLELAALMAKRITPSVDENACYADVSGEELVSQLAEYYPYIAGLGPNKKVVLQTSPPHAAMPCLIQVEVPYSEVKSYFHQDSKVHKWLK